jgi:hypothetical protein
VERCVSRRVRCASMTGCLRGIAAGEVEDQGGEESCTGMEHVCPLRGTAPVAGKFDRICTHRKCISISNFKSLVQLFVSVSG